MTLNEQDDDDDTKLCKNYYNKSVKELVESAKKNGGDAVIEVRSITFHIDGSNQVFKEPQCFDDGAEGQVLTRGIAIRWKPLPPEKAPVAKKVAIPTATKP